MEHDKIDNFALAIREPGYLDRPIEELIPIQVFGDAALAQWRVIIGRIDTLDLSAEEKKSVIHDANNHTMRVYEIEARIGELLPMPEETGPALPGGNAGRWEKGARRLPDSITSKKAHTARIFAEAKADGVFSEVIAKAESAQEVANKAQVITIVIKKRRAKTDTETRAKPVEEQLRLKVKDTTAPCHKAGQALGAVIALAEKAGATEFAGLEAYRLKLELETLSDLIATTSAYVESVGPEDDDEV